MVIVATTRKPNPRWILRGILSVLALYAIVILALMFWWSYEPDQFDVVKFAQERAAQHQQPVVTGAVVTGALIGSAETLLDKRGGYISNDKFPPGLFMDNVPNWEFGVLTATRDLAREMRNKFSRSQSQSEEDKDLQEADPLFSSPNDRWLLPSSEGQYRKAIDHVEGYLQRLGKNDPNGAQFFARADSLADYLDTVSTRLGSLSQRLSASVGQLQLQGDAPVDPNAPAASPKTAQVVQTPWDKIDDVFYESRGYSWALLEQLKAVEVDFAPILERKNAMVSLKQVIRELQESQKPVMSPIILNGSPFGFFANHSLVMANYVSRANAAIIDLKSLLNRG
ncbi:MAG TPA: DUF2333 family protein [Rudaea sp.]|jgi:hypothetical protein|uniref:DUF2333 family protein n=1 Tax=Rudaea sp. TaxID=2136325 RepID=UPI002F95B74C